jgi:hypothetical protein
VIPTKIQNSSITEFKDTEMVKSQRIWKPSFKNDQWPQRGPKDSNKHMSEEINLRPAWESE